MIKINIENKRKFAAIATLVDRTQFIEQVSFLREKLSLSKQIIPNEEFDKYYAHGLDYSLDTDQIGYYNKMVEELEFLKSRNWHNEFDEEIRKLKTEIDGWQDPKHNFLSDVDQILRKNEVDEKYRFVVIKAVICGEIREEDFPYQVTSSYVENIIRDRDWYWLNKRRVERMGYSKISKKFGEHIRTVENAVKSYAARLR